MKLFLMNIVLGTLFLIQADAQSPVGPCAQANPLIANLQAQVLETSKGCSVMISPSTGATEVRRYIFSERGVLQIFNQYSGNRNGSRSFFLFPRAQVPALDLVNAGQVNVVTSAKNTIQFDAKANPPHILDDANSDLRLIESSLISESNNGGVEIVLGKHAKTLILDTGFIMGGAAFTDPTRSSSFYDSAGDHCTLKNSILFSFSNDDADLKFGNDAELFQFLKTACPTLKLPTL